MSSRDEVARTGFSDRHGLIAGLGALGGIGVTELRPMIGLWLGVAAALAGVMLFLIKRVPRWVPWLSVGLAIGVACYYLLALYWILNPNPGSGSGGG